MNTDIVAKLTEHERFFYWIREREKIRTRKERGEPKPWTDDDILQNYRFCNVVRMDDKVSRWLAENWYKKFYDHPNILPAIALARFVNLPSSLAAVGFPTVWDGTEIKDRLRKAREKGPIFNGAYMVRGNDGMDKVECVVDYYVQPLVDNPPAIETDSMEQTHANLLTYYGMGSFMAGQIVADLRHAKTGTWRDKNNWAPLGPGSMRGMNRLLCNPLKKPISQEYFNVQLKELIQLCRPWMIKFDPFLFVRMEAHDFQNCLCEFDKYERCLFGEGKPKSKYSGK